VLMGGRAEGLTCADPGARTPIGASGNLQRFIQLFNLLGKGTGDNILLKKCVIYFGFVFFYTSFYIKYEPCKLKR
jgi:hypothetical protein